MGSNVGRTNFFFLLIEPILFLYYELSVCSRGMPIEFELQQGVSYGLTNCQTNNLDGRNDSFEG